MEDVPHLQVPFQIVGSRASTVEQDTLAEIAQNVRVIVATRPNQRVSVPDFGVDDPTFSNALDVSEIEEAVERFEDRAVLTFEESGTDERDLVIRVGRND